MKPTFRKSMIWLHTYAALCSGWLLFIVFLTGTLSYYNTELTHWISGNQIVQNIEQKSLLQHGIEKLQQQAPEARSWQIKLPTDRGGLFSLSYQQENKREQIYINPNDLKEYEPIATNGGDFFRTFHYSLSLNQWGGRFFTGIAAMLMLVGIFTGIYTHRRFFKDFFTLRTSSWEKYLKDLHALIGIITIPFCLVICLSALFIYINLYLPNAINHHFESYRHLDKEVSSRYSTLTPSENINNEVIPLNSIWNKLEQQWGINTLISSVDVDLPSHENSRIIFHKLAQNNLSNKTISIAFNKRADLLPKMEEERVARKIRRIFYGLHEAHFAGSTLRFMLFFLGLISSLLIASGMVIWLQKRQLKKKKISYLFFGKVNVAVLYGLPLAIGCYLLSSRLPINLTMPLQEFELTAFFTSWLFSLLLCLTCTEFLSKSTIFISNSGIYFTLLMLDALSSKGHLMQAIQHKDYVYLGITTLLLFTTGYFTYMTCRIRSKKDD